MLIIPMWLEFIFREYLNVGERKHRFYYSPLTHAWWERKPQPLTNPSNMSVEEVCSVIHPTLNQIKTPTDINEVLSKLRTYLTPLDRWNTDPTIIFTAVSIKQNDLQQIRWIYCQDTPNPLPWTCAWKSAPQRRNQLPCYLWRNKMDRNHIEVEGLLRDDECVLWRRIVGVRITKDPDAENPVFGFTKSEWRIYNPHYPYSYNPPTTYPRTLHYEQRIPTADIKKKYDVYNAIRLLTNPYLS